MRAFYSFQKKFRKNALKDNVELMRLIQAP